MAVMKIPIHVAKKDGGGVRIITAAKRVEELGANAFIVSAATAAKLLEDSPKQKVVTKTKTKIIEKKVDLEGMARSAALEISKLPGIYVPAGLEGAILRGLKSKLS